MESIYDLLLLVKYVLLGLLQGVTEPLPISSSGHLVLIQELFAIHLPGLSFEMIVHFGSLIAICAVYQKDMIRLLINSWRYVRNYGDVYYTDFRFILLLCLATLPAGIIGLFFGDMISERFSTTGVVGATLLVTGLFLWIIRNLRGEKGYSHVSIKDAVIIGCAQAIALVPGISRSGATLVAALLCGLDRDTALRFSFLLFIPVSFGTTVFSISDFVQDETLQHVAIPLIIALITSIIATFFALKWFMNVMKKGNLKYFAFYCLILGTCVLFL